MYICQPIIRYVDKIIENIFGQRLRLARKMAGLSLQELADLLDCQVSKQSLNKYEMGQMKPSSEVLMALSSCLRLKPDYFFKNIDTQVGTIAFRKASKMSKKEDDAVIEEARFFLERYQEIENIMNLNQPFINPVKDLAINSFEDVEKAAIILRQKWELGKDPISNIIEMLEIKGVKIYLVDAIDRFDGFATISNLGNPFIVINKNSKNIERLRFTVLHELAHILLSIDPVHPVNKVEEFCHHFSSCMLIPSDMLIKLIGSPKRSYIDIKELIRIKEYFGISIRAIVHRLMRLEVITENYYKRWVIYMSKTYGSKNEPGHYHGIEIPKMLEQLINQALAEGLISISKASYLANLPINQIVEPEIYE